MNNNRLLTMLFVLCLPLLLLTGCTKESDLHCYKELEIMVRAYADGVELDDTTVSDITVYVFDQEQRFLKQFDTHVNQLIRLNYRDVTEYTIVALGNGKHGGVTLPVFSVGDPMTNGIVRLKSTRANLYPIYPTTDDVFLGLKERVPNDKSQSGKIVIPVSRVMASAAITIKGLREYFGVFDDNYSVIVRKTKSEFDFFGRFSGEYISHSPAGSFNTTGIYLAPNFNLLPTEPGDKISIDIYNGTTLVSTAIADNNGNPMVAQAGKLLNVLIDFNANVQVTIVTTPWGQVHTWKDWN